MRELAERGWFRLCAALGRLLRTARYSSTLIVHEDGELRVRKRRAPYAPLVIGIGGPLLGILGTGVRVLARREWQERERTLWQGLRGTSITVDADGTLVLPWLTGETLATLLERPALDASVRRRAIECAVVALRQLHRLGFTHGDALAENLVVDLEAGAAHWLDFETVHDPRRPMTWRRADDVRALLESCLLRTAPEHLAGTLAVVLDAYADDGVTRLLAATYASPLQRPLAFHLGQAGLSRRCFGNVASLLQERVSELEAAASRGTPASAARSPRGG